MKRSVRFNLPAILCSGYFCDKTFTEAGIEYCIANKGITY